MPTLTLFIESVNESPTPDLGNVALAALALVGLVVLTAAARVLRRALVLAVQLVETALAVGLVAIIVLAVVFAAGYAVAMRH